MSDPIKGGTMGAAPQNTKKHLKKLIKLLEKCGMQSAHKTTTKM